MPRGRPNAVVGPAAPEAAARPEPSGALPAGAGR